MKKIENAKRNPATPLGSLFMLQAATHGMPTAPVLPPVGSKKNAPTAKPAQHTWAQTNAFGGWPSDKPANKTTNAKKVQVPNDADVTFGYDGEAMSQLPTLKDGINDLNARLKKIKVPDDADVTFGYDGEAMSQLPTFKDGIDDLKARLKKIKVPNDADVTFGYDGEAMSQLPTLKDGINDLKARNDEKKRQNKAAAAAVRHDFQFGKGNIDLTNRPQYTNKDGSTSTVDSIAFSIGGKEVLLPQIWYGKNGKAYHSKSNEETLKHYRDTGEYLGTFDTVKDANAYAEDLRKQQEEMLHNPAPYSVEGKSFLERMNAMYDNMGKAETGDPWAADANATFAYSQREKTPLETNRFENMLNSIGTGFVSGIANLIATVTDDDGSGMDPNAAFGDGKGTTLFDEDPKAKKFWEEVSKKAGEVGDKYGKEAETSKVLAKDGLGFVGDTLTDVGIDAGQTAMGTALSGGSEVAASAIQFARTMGDSIKVAKDAGANNQQAVNYGITKGLYDILPGKVTKYLKKDGKTTVDDVIDSVAHKLADSETGRASVKLFATGVKNGSESILSDFVDPLMKIMYTGQTIAESYKTNFDLSETLHDGIVGTFLSCAQGTGDLAKGVKADIDMTHGSRGALQGMSPTISKALKYKDGSATKAYALGLQEKLNDAAVTRGDPHITDFDLNLLKKLMAEDETKSGSAKAAAGTQAKPTGATTPNGIGTAPTEQPPAGGGLKPKEAKAGTVFIQPTTDRTGEKGLRVSNPKGTTIPMDEFTRSVNAWANANGVRVTPNQMGALYKKWMSQAMK